VTAEVLVGRETELADLVQLLRRVREHGAVLALVTGPRSVGRTSLLAALAEVHDGPVRRATGAAWESGRSGGVLAQLTGRALPADPVGAADALSGDLAGAGGDAPALVVVDDAQHADLASLQALVSLVRHHAEQPILVVLAAPAGMPRDVAPGVADLLASAPTTRLPLAPLDAAGVGRLAASRGVALSPWAAERLHRHTGGLPRAVVALLEELPRTTWSNDAAVLPAPSLVTGRVRAALASLGADARALVAAGSVLGGVRQLDVAARLAGVTDVWPALDEAVGAGLLVVTGPAGGQEVAPADPMVAAAVRAELGPSRVAQLHAGAAGLVTDQAAALRHRVAASALPDAALADELAALADQRAAEGAWGEAAGLLTDASRLTEDRLLRESRLTRAVDALVGAGDGRGAAALVPEVESLRETPLRNAALGYLAILRGRATEAEARLGRAWALVNADRDPAIAGLICQRYVLHALSRCRWDDLVTWADRAIELVGPDDPAGVESAAIRGLGLVAAGRRDEAVAAYRDLSERVRHGAQAQRIRLGAGWLHLCLDEVDDARAELESAVPTTYLGGSARISLWARAWLARTQFLTGEWDQALRTVEDARDLLDTSGIVLARPLLDWTAVQVHALRGDWDAARSALHHAESAAQDYEVMRIPTALARAAVAEARADDEAVVRALTPLTVNGLADAVHEPGYWPWVDTLASALVGAGRPAEADALLRPHEERAARLGSRSVSARLGRARGRLLAATNDLAGARRSFDAALEALEGLPLRVDRARTTFAYGQVLRRAGKRREADALISTARDEYDTLGATTYVARCDRELKAGGVHAVRVDRAPEDLTPQEQAVTDLVVQGLSNREVAAQLFLSPKTVQYHLTRVFAKLGVRSRTELAVTRGPGSGDDEK
jgi:DNA-binding CsgD family transcriptional regulator